MEICEEVTVHRSGTSEPKMVASDSFPPEELVQNSVENLKSRLSLFSRDNDNNNIPQTIEVKTSADYDSESGCSQNDKVFDSCAAIQDSDSLKLDNGEFSPLQADGSNRQDTYSITSSLSSNSSSSSLSSMGITFETEKRLNTSSHEQKPVKVFGPADENQSNGNESQAHPRIRRVPSTANPKYRVPSLQRNQRSKSQPHIQVNHVLNQRRNSSPSHLNQGNIPNTHSRTMRPVSSSPNFNQVSHQYIHQPRESQQQQQQPQQQIIYLQIPQPSQTQLCDPQGLQQQISSQLQLLVPQIYNQLLNQMNVNSAQLNTVKVSLDQNNSNKTNLDTSTEEKDHHVDNNSYLNSNFTMEGNQSQRVMNQVLTQNSLTKSCSNPKASNSQPKRQRPQRQSNLQKAPSLESLSENEGTNKQLSINDLSQILQHIPAQVLQQNYSKSQPFYIEIQQLPGYPKLTIPVTQELLLQCQQLQQLREPGFVPYQPRLETILEESLSVKHLKMSRFSKTKVVACVITVLCVVVVVLLAGDKVIAVAVIAAIFILFLLASTFYLYTHSSKSDMDDSISSSDSSRIQISTLSKCDKSSFP